MSTAQEQLLVKEAVADMFSEPAPHSVNLAQHAQEALDLGLYIFPLRPKSKKTVPGSHGFKDSSYLPGVIEAWWTNTPEANIGVDCGKSNLAVIDIDIKEDTPQWLLNSGTYYVATKRGYHFYFWGSRKTQDVYDDKGKHIGECKSIGGYILAHGSIHPDGPVYTKQNDKPILPMPEDKFALLIKDAPKKSPANIQGEPILRGSHDTELYRIGCNLRRQGMEFEAIKAALMEVAENRLIDKGSDWQDMVHKKAEQAMKHPPGKDERVVFGTAQQTVGIEPAPDPTNWRDYFKPVGGLEAGDVRMLIDGFLPEGVTFIGGLPGEGKTLFAISMVKALTTGEAFLGQFDIPEAVPVLYLIPESGGRAFRKRLEAFGIPNDPSKFLCRTISEGSTLLLNDPIVLQAVKELKPVVFIDTAIRFNNSTDENSASQNKQLVDDVIALRQAGAVGVVGLHHATKAMRANGMTLESALRGSGDIAASADAVYGLLRDDLTYKGGLGPNEVTVQCLKPRDFTPPEPFRLALTEKNEGHGFTSLIDTTGDFKFMVAANNEQRSGERLMELVVADPNMSVKELSEATHESTWVVRKLLKQYGYIKRAGKGGIWSNSPPSTPPNNLPGIR